MNWIVVVRMLHSEAKGHLQQAERQCAAGDPDAAQVGLTAGTILISLAEAFRSGLGAEPFFPPAKD